MKLCFQNEILIDLQTIPVESEASYYWNVEMAIVPKSRGVENPGYSELADKSVGSNDFVPCYRIDVWLNFLGSYVPLCSLTELINVYSNARSR